jgi:NAD(P)-dependent dehydrogenase (short-subunit alcohol dehydrogenase family)
MAGASTGPGQLLDFAGRVVLVTGGTDGIGRGIAERFLAAGADVAMTGPSAPGAPPADGTREAMHLEADVRAPEQVDGLVGAVAERWGRLDAVVNYAAAAPEGDAATTPPDQSTAVIARHLLAPIHVAQAANALMQGQADGGAIVNITSVDAFRPSPRTALHAAAHAGVIALARSLAVEWAPKVRVNCVSAGAVGDGSDPLDGSEDAPARLAAAVPAGRLGEARDLADACLYLTSPLAAYVSGANIVLDGGGRWPAFMGAVPA